MSYMVPFGSLLSPIIYDIVGPVLRGIMFLNKKEKHNIVHVLHHLNSPILPLISNFDVIKKVTTIHHIPEYLDPDYEKIVKNFLVMFLGNVGNSTIKSIIYRAYTSDLGSKFLMFQNHDVFTFRLALRYSDAFIAVSSQTASDLRRLFYDEIKSKKIYISFHGSIDFCRKISYNSLLNRKNSEKFIIGYVGAHEFRKGILILPVLASYMKKFGLTSERIRIEVWGKGPLSNMLYYLVKKLNVYDLIKIMGSFPRNDVIKIYKNFDIQIFPTLLEGFGLPIIEAGSLGIPSLVLKIAKIPREVREVAIEASDLEDLVRKIIDFMENRDLLYEAKMKALTQSCKFTWQNTALTTLSAYRDLLGE